MTEEEQSVYEEMVQEKSPEFFCDNCYFYPIIPVHGHFECTQCYYKSKCCEGMAIELE